MRLMLGWMMMAGALLGADAATEIRAVLQQQQEAWNRGDLVEFVKSYEESPEITFVGKDVARGYAGVLARYQKSYPDKARMGKLTFSEVEARMLGADHALVLGRFALEREAAAGGPASGRYTLVAKRSGKSWKFIHDHTSN
jgi:uncharacterized protein (TIGR02246 family)